jgi:Phycodnaviridae exonuclease
METKQKVHPKVLKFLGREYEDQRSQEWFKKRERLSTCSDLGAILGKNKYESQAHVFLKKTGQLAKKEGPGADGNWMTQHGVVTEAEAAAKYAAKTGEECIEVGFIRHPKYDWIGGSPDRIALKSGRLVEIKCVVTREIIEGYVPEMYWCQVQGLLEVCDLDECDFVQYKQESWTSEEILSITTIKRDREWFESVKDKIRDFTQKLRDWFEKDDERKELQKKLESLPPDEDEEIVQDLTSRIERLTVELNTDDRPKRKKRKVAIKVDEEQEENSKIFSSCVIADDE